MKKQKSFTLIELMVVISIIGLISSIVLVAVNSAREKAKRAAGLQFAASVHHALGAEAVGIWDFDDQTANDSSGNNNHGIIYGATFTTDTPSGNGYAMSFDGVDDYVNVTDSNNLDLTTTATIGVWIKTNSFAANQAIIARDTNGYILGLYTTGKLSWGKNGVDEVQSASALTTGNWYHIAVTRGGNINTIYINGIYDNSGVKADFTALVTPILIGDAHPAGWNFNGPIDDVRIYEQALSEAQIKQLYAEGAKSHGHFAEEK